MKKLLLLLALGVGSFKAFSQDLMAEWLFEPPTTPGTLLPNYGAPGLITPSNFSSGPGLTVPGAGFIAGPGGAGDRAVVRTGWNAVAPAYLLDDYYQFELAAIGPSVTINEVSFYHIRSNGPSTWELRGSMDGFSSSFFVVGSGAVSANAPGNPWQYSQVGMTVVFSAGQTLTFRLYGTGASNTTTGSWRVDSVRVKGFENSPLPISLLSFTGEVVGSKSFLKWQTATEEENDFFTIERSEDTEVWETLGTVPGALTGNSQTIQEYSFVDDTPPTGTTYYRLLQTDFDGTVRNYQTIALWREESVPSIYPNPARKGEILRIEGGAYSLVEILDGSGKLAVKKYAYEALVLDLASGMYLVRVTDMEGRTSTQRLILIE